jgi:hypothetical protein
LILITLVTCGRPGGCHPGLVRIDDAVAALAGVTMLPATEMGALGSAV